MFEEYKDVVSVRELSYMLKISKVSAYRLLKSKAIKSRRIGQVHKILKKDVIAYLESESEMEM